MLRAFYIFFNLFYAFYTPFKLKKLHVKRKKIGEEIELLIKVL